MKRLLLTAAIVAASGAANAETIGVSLPLFDDNWLTGLRNGMQDYATSLGDVTLNMEDAQGDISRQQNQVQNFIASGVDGIIVTLVDADSGPAISQAAADAGIPLVFINNAPANVDSLPDGQSFVGSDDVEAGTLQATEVCRLLNGTGKAVVLMGQLGTTGSRGRTEGVHDVLSSDDCKGIEILDEQTANWMRTPAMDLMTNWLTAGLEFDAVLANNDEMALGAIQAMKASGRDMDTVVVGGVDGTQDALSAISEGDLDLTVFQNAVGQGQSGVDAILGLIRDEPVEKKTFVPFELITPENLSDYTQSN